LIHILCLKCVRSSFQEKSSAFDRKEDFTSDFKEDWRFEEAPSIKGSKVEQNSRRHGRATGVHGRAPEPETSAIGKLDARPGSRRTAVRWCTHGCALLHDWPCVGAWPCRHPSARFRLFSIIYMFFLGAFWGLRSFFWEQFKEKN